MYLERGTRKVFACALDWPGWCRSARTAELSLIALAGYARRYAVVAIEAGVAFDADPYSLDQTYKNEPISYDLDIFEVTESVMGGSTTDFGAPGAIPVADVKPVTAELATWHVALLRASWALLDRVAILAPHALRKGPRGGGRELGKILDHVVAAEAAYARRLGIRCRPPIYRDRLGVSALRAEIVAVLGKPSDGSLFVPTGWPARYAVRRIAWHVLDHAWEIQDRSQ
ncbi:MAG: hypothetical protein JXA67_18375 [Micromonosporaceae bacterium]|nr:hypothetical protein [Micromonosporaceae bacterium]